MAGSALTQICSWRDEFKVDQPKIDSEHQGIFKLTIEASELARRADDNDKLMAVVGKFGSVLEAHFRYEDGTLTEIGYPHLEQRREQCHAC